VTAAVGIWARENAEFLGTARFPLAHFLKNSEEYVEAAKLRPLDPEEDDNEVTLEDIRPPGYVPLRAAKSISPS
jgi:hypothetical protein